SAPEAMAYTAGKEYIEMAVDLDKYQAIGAGPGWGQHTSHASLLGSIIDQTQRALVLDADALNVLAENKPLQERLPVNTIITPHPKEFERLFGKTANDFERMELALAKAADLKIIIVLKGRYTLVATPGGIGYFNPTGNPGMATGGSGDVLTGIITGLAAQHYTPQQATLLGVYLHGLAGDLAASYRSQEALIASDLIEHFGEAFTQARQ
ncbi:MAG: NAD(P)H-hydrate dehydratase, partial [Chitinophagaceae bacterium]